MGSSDGDHSGWVGTLFGLAAIFALGMITGTLTERCGVWGGEDEPAPVATHAPADACEKAATAYMEISDTVVSSDYGFASKMNALESRAPAVRYHCGRWERAVEYGIPPSLFD